jgi:hypothetical protein
LGRRSKLDLSDAGGEGMSSRICELPQEEAAALARWLKSTREQVLAACTVTGAGRPCFAAAPDRSRVRPAAGVTADGEQEAEPRRPVNVLNIQKITGKGLKNRLRVCRINHLPRSGETVVDLTR